MSEILISVILGVIQGCGEFLPISSSGHLILARYLLNLDLNFTQEETYLAFDVFLHFGTLLAVLFYFREKLWRFFFKPYQPVVSKKIVKSGIKSYFKRLFLFLFSKSPREKKIFTYLVIATIPGAVFGFFLEDLVEAFFRKPSAVALMLIVGALVLALADYVFHRKQKNEAELALPYRTKRMEDLGWWRALIIGFFQALAIFPGFSRSGGTISGALFLGLNRREAARFSFILSIPIIFGAALSKVPVLFEVSFNPAIIISGVLAAALAGFLSIKYMLRYVTSHSYTVFVVYRIILALLILFFFME